VPLSSLQQQTHDLVLQVLGSLQETNKQLVILNGRTRHLEEREEAHSQHLGCLDEQVTKLREAREAAKVKDEVHDKELDWTRGKLWTAAIEIAKIGAGAGVGGGIVALVLKGLEK